MTAPSPANRAALPMSSLSASAQAILDVLIAERRKEPTQGWMQLIVVKDLSALGLKDFVEGLNELPYPQLFEKHDGPSFLVRATDEAMKGDHHE